MSSQKAKELFSLATLATILATMFTPLILWAFSEVTDIKPMLQAVNANTKALIKMTENDKKQHNEVLQLVHRQEIQTASDRAYLETLKEKCESNTRKIQDCQDRVNKELFTFRMGKVRNKKTGEQVSWLKAH